MDKYIVEIDGKNIYSDDNGSQLALSVKVNDASAIFCTEIPLTPYTEPDMEQVRKEAYEDGYKTAKVQCNIQAEKDLREVGERHYQKGLSDAWETARKIGSNSMCSLEEMGFDFSQCVIPDYNPSWFVVKNYSASEAIEKIRQYELEKEEQIQVGDEVKSIERDWTAVVVRISNDDSLILMDSSGAIADAYNKTMFVKTGRHFPEIAEVLQKMRES